MKKYLILTALIFCGAYAFAQTGEIKVTVTDIDAKKGGQINIAVYVMDGFLVTGKEIQAKSIKVSANEASTSFTDFPVGTYAIAVYHDENSDNKLNANFIGIPKEPVGFSNNKFGKMGPPDFELVSFTLVSGKTTVLSINLK